MMHITSDSFVLFGALETWLIPTGYAALGGVAVLLAVYTLYLLMRLVMPKLAAIAMATSKEALAQPLFYVILFVGITALLSFPFIPYNTLGEDIKMLKDTGQTVILLGGIVLALWTASVSIADEIEGRTALTLLSKPITRRQFIIGKFLGILAPVVLLFVVLGVVFLGTVAFKVVYDARETASAAPTMQQCLAEVIQITPGLILALMETVIMASISVAISTRLPMMSNLMICTAIYILGHLVPYLVNSRVGEFEIVAFIGKLIAIVLPVLDNFNVGAAIATGSRVPASYLVWAFLYCAVYTAVAMLVALIMVEDRDLA